MQLAIRSVRRATDREWDNIWQSANSATYFQSREWSEIWSVYTQKQLRPDPRLVCFSDGRKAMWPLTCEPMMGGLYKNFFASPAGTFGGWLSAEVLTAEHALLLANYLTEKLGNLVWRLNPYEPLCQSVPVGMTQADVTHVLKLDGGQHVVSARWSKARHSDVKKARRNGVEVSVAETRQEWESYYEVYKDSLRRWGGRATSRYEWAIFEEMQRRQSPHIRLWLGRYSGEIVSGALCFYAPRHVVYWHGATREEHLSVRPAALVLAEAILHACEHKYEWFDFNPSGRHAGVREFKERFGAQPMNCPMIRGSTAMAMRLRGLKRKLNLARVSNFVRRWTTANDSLNALTGSSGRGDV